MRFLYLLTLCFFGLALQAQSTVALVWESGDRIGRALTVPVPAATPAAAVGTHAGLTVVRARVDGEWGNFILDTGAPGLVLNAVPDAAATECAAGLLGEVQSDYRLVRRFVWQGMRYENLTALQIDLRGIEQRMGIPLKGLFGYELLRDHVLELDLANELLVLNPERLSDARNVLRIDTRSRLPIVKVKIDGRTYRFGIDSGASVNVLGAHVLDRLKTTAYTEKAGRKVCGVGAQGKTLRVVELEDLKVAGQVEAGTVLSVSDLAQFRKDHGIRLDGILGRPFLERHRVTIDYPARRLYVE